MASADGEMTVAVKLPAKKVLREEALMEQRFANVVLMIVIVSDAYMTAVTI
jgi:hypothetical protein